MSVALEKKKWHSLARWRARFHRHLVRRPFSFASTGYLPSACGDEQLSHASPTMAAGPIFSGAFWDLRFRRNFNCRRCLRPAKPHFRADKSRQLGALARWGVEFAVVVSGKPRRTSAG